MKRKNIGIFTGVLLSAFAALNLNAAAIKTGTSAPKMKPVLTVEYEYSRSGQIIGRKINGRKQSYKYDKKGQLLGVYDEKGNAVEEYVYDPAGNILKKTIHGRTTTYKYDKANQLVSSECNKKVTKYEYDAAGRLVKEGDKVYSYIGLDKIESVTEGGRKLSSFTYHIDGQLAARVSIESSETFHWDGLALIQRNSTSYVNEPAVTGGNPILADDKILFNDMLGTTLGVKDGDKVTQNNLTAFGESLSASPMQDSFFTGKPHVGEMGYVFLFRAYRADQGKWQTSDPLGYPDGWNNFAYCNNWVNDAIDLFGGILLSTESATMTTSPYEIVTIELSAIITNTLIAMGAFKDLSYKVGLTANGNDTGNTPVISGEQFLLTGSPTSSGGGFSLSGVGYSFTYSVRIGSTTLASSKTEINDDGSNTLINRYQVKIIADWDYVCLGSYKGSTVVQTFYMTLSHTRPE